ncbi:MAG: hypothetical protein NTW25_11735 [Candidatus Kapabacteria bacterium]|nr:hypothetical protein [Candidatus Kapabacteria bacterium]
MQSFNLTITILMSLVFCSCDLFSTRTPANPDTSQNSLQPATSQEILIQNFKTSIEIKNTDGYLICFADTNRKTKNFQFVASSNGLSLFAGLFDKWTNLDERRYINNLFSNISQEIKPLVDLKTIEKSDFPDSSIYLINYKLSINLIGKSIPSYYNGQMQFTIVNNNSGQWFIQRWLDLGSQSNDTLQSNSWSILKGKFYN